jgi:uncharacterized metal-binding protein YceD (DUF177 family)
MDEHPFSRLVTVDDLPSQGMSMTVEASAEERVALAQMDGLVAIAQLSGRYWLKPTPGGGVHVKGAVQAQIEQTCTVSLEPFSAEIEEPVDVAYSDENGLRAWQTKRLAQKDEPSLDEDPPDLVIDGQIDLGALTAEFLALGIDPYPRKPGVTLESQSDKPDENPSPFAALANLQLRS